jgi:hypothetical protein
MNHTLLFKERRDFLATCELEKLQQEAREWCFAHGLIIYDKETADKAFPRPKMIPIALFPSPFPQKWYEWAEKAQPLFNRLIDRISQHETFLIDALRG